MSCVQDCFSFLRGGEDSDDVRSELIGFLDGYDWQDFLESVTNESLTAKGSVISSLVKKIRTGVVGSEALKDYDPRVLVDAMGGSLDSDFLDVLVDLMDKGSHSAAPFLAALVQAYPGEVVEKLRGSHLHDKGLADVTVVLLGVYFRTHVQPLLDFFIRAPLKVILPGLYEHIRTTEVHDTRQYSQLLLNIAKKGGFFDELHAVVACAIRDRCEPCVDAILDFMEQGHASGLFSYSEAFAKVFEQRACPFIQGVLVRRAATTNETLVQVQIELLDAKSAAPLKDILRSRHSPFGTDELLRLAEVFHRSREIPVEISKRFMFERKAVTDVLAPALRTLARTNAAADELVHALETKGMIPKNLAPVNWEQTLNLLKTSDNAMAGIADVLEQSKADCKTYAPELFNSFHRALYARHADDIVGFVDAFEMKVLKRMPFASQEKLADVVVQFLCSNLADQHRWSLSMIALRCDIGKFVQRLLECQCEREIKALVFLHKAAIVSASKVKLEGKASVGSIDLAESISHGLAKLPNLVVQRLRWRVLRGDATDTVCWLPEFLVLAESDLPLFFTWECGQDTNYELLSRLGITTSASLYPKFLAIMLASDPPASVTRVMLPLLSRIDKDEILIPENPNMRVLFETSILWCPRVMCHSSVLACLRSPSPAVSQALLNALPASDTDKLFAQFPHGFAAMLYNFKELYGDRPRYLCDAFRVVEGDLAACPDAPKFVVVAVVAACARRHSSLVELAQKMKDPTWATYCFVFSVCLHRHEDAIELLHAHDYLFRVMRQGVTEEYAFFGQGAWGDSLIEFALYCAYNSVSFGNTEEWKLFLKTVKQASWPDWILVDNENLRVMQSYCNRYCL